MWGPLAQSIEPWNLDCRVPGSSLGQGGELCPWAGQDTLSTLLKQLKWEMLRLCGVEVKSRVSRRYHTNKNVCTWKGKRKKKKNGGVIRKESLQKENIGDLHTGTNSEMDFVTQDKFVKLW